MERKNAAFHCVAASLLLLLPVHVYLGIAVVPRLYRVPEHRPRVGLLRNDSSFRFGSYGTVLSWSRIDCNLERTTRRRNNYPLLFLCVFLCRAGLHDQGPTQPDRPPEIPEDQLQFSFSRRVRCCWVPALCLRWLSTPPHLLTGECMHVFPESSVLLRSSFLEVSFQ